MNYLFFCECMSFITDSSTGPQIYRYFQDLIKNFDEGKEEGLSLTYRALLGKTKELLTELSLKKKIKSCLKFA